MRLAGYLPDKKSALQFSNYLYAHRIDNQVEPEPDGRFSLWIHDDDQVAEGAAELEQYLANPHDRKYLAAQTIAERRHKEQLEREQAPGGRVIDARTSLGREEATLGFLTVGLITIAVGVAVIRMFPEYDAPLQDFLLIHDFQREIIATGEVTFLHDVRQGQVWRLVTPIFLHFGLLHILFNVSMLFQLGNRVELLIGTFRFAILTLAAALAGNLAQYYVVGPFFGGLSGVVYALFGYCWIRGRYDYQSGLTLDRGTVGFLLAWFLLGFTGFLGMANWAHLGGLLVGMIAGALAIRRIPFTSVRW